jgi:hypothetical protein
MRYLALASDYDETLARHGQLATTTIQALSRFRSTGRKTILVTGREILELQTVCPNLDLFDLIVGENGAVIYNPHCPAEITPLADAPPSQFAIELKKIGVTPLSCGKVIVATLSDQSEAVHATIARLHLDLVMVFNKGSLMVLPKGINKATGLRHALTLLDISPERTWAIGDAENDIDFLTSVNFPAAVANALPSVKSHAVFISEREAGAGVEELIEKILSEDV